MKQIEKFIVGFAWLALILAIVEIIMQSYGDYIIFSLFVHDVHSFFKFNFINWPYYVFPLGIIIAVLKKQYIYLCLIVFLIPSVMRGQVHYLYKIWLHPNTITFLFATILAIIVCVMVVCALIAGLLSIANLKEK